LIDIRSADAEDLQNWAEANPDKPVPSEQFGKRLRRFTDAFDYIFPTKRFRKIERIGNAFELLFEDSGRISNINQLSTGEKQIVFRGGFVLKELAHVQSGLLLVDEPELSLSPEWQARILGFYQRLIPQSSKSATQLIVATHSPFIIHGAPNAKVIILEKDSTGKIQVMPDPNYPIVGGNAAIRAFNVDAFLAAAKYPVLVLVEGESDEILLNTAWSKLYPDDRRFFEVRSALGAKNVQITLNDQQLFTRLGSQKIVGLFDFDAAYNQWNGVWRKASSYVVLDAAKSLTRKHSSERAWAMLLPVPAHRADFASAELAGESILSIEFLFQDIDIPHNFIKMKKMPKGTGLPYFDAGQKVAFANHVQNLPASSFDAFVPIFERLRHIEAGRI